MKEQPDQQLCHDPANGDENASNKQKVPPDMGYSAGELEHVFAWWVKKDKEMAADEKNQAEM